MKLSTFAFLIIYAFSLFLPIIHLVEVSHGHNEKIHETHESIDTTSKSPECKESVVNNDLEKSISILSQNIWFIDIPKNTYFQEEICLRKNIPIPLPKGQDPPFKNTYSSLVWIIKIQIFDVI